jgi:hypothetical protein
LDAGLTITAAVATSTSTWRPRPNRRVVHNEIELEVRLQKALGERRVDLVVHARGTPLGALDRIAERQGALL